MVPLRAGSGPVPVEISERSATRNMAGEWSTESTSTDGTFGRDVMGAARSRTAFIKAKSSGYLQMGPITFNPWGATVRCAGARINHGRFQRFQISGGMVVGVRDAPGGGGDAAVGALHSKDPAVTCWNSDGPSHISTQLHGAVLLSNGHA